MNGDINLSLAQTNHSSLKLWDGCPPLRCIFPAGVTLHKHHPQIALGPIALRPHSINLVQHRSRSPVKCYQRDECK
ncbi:MAG: hypothetical protein WBA89_07435 [Microcoleus sp.]|uniref:hypothetical protein n=1 Tax=Microcoleus sp. TaxID=44472 RepID=UPI003C72C212